MTTPTIDPTTVVTPAPDASVVTPPAAPAPGPTPTPDVKKENNNTFTVPEKYAKEPWAQGIKSTEDLFNQFANAQTVIGRKGIVLPTDKSTPEEVKNFRSALGVPETPEGYEFKSLEELKDKPRDAEVDNLVKTTLFKQGVPKSAGEQIIRELETLVLEKAKPKIEALKKQEQAFAAMKLATFGDKTEVAAQAFEQVMTDTFGESSAQLKGKLDSLPPEARLVTIAFAKAIHDKYVGEHKLVPPAPGGEEVLSADIKTAYQQLSQAKLQIRDDKTIPEHVRTQRLQELNRKMQDIGKKASEAGINLFA